MTKEKEILEKITALEDKIANIEFLVVQMMGGGGSPPPTASTSAPAPTGSVSVDLTPVNAALERIESILPTKSDILNMQSEFNKIVEGKIKQSEEVMNKATLLLEKGLQMTELETTLLEIKDRLEEVTIQLSAVEQQTIEE